MPPADSEEERWEAYFYPDVPADPETGKRPLRNLAGFKDMALLDDYEYSMTAARAQQLAAGAVDIPRTYDAEHLRALHRHLFQDVYEWAGEFRTINMAKASKRFSYVDRPPERPEVHEYLAHVTKHARETPWAELGHQEFALGAARVFTYLNEAHPFREGNGRTSKAFMRQLAEESRFALDFDRVTSFEWNIGSQAARPYPGDFHPRPHRMVDVWEAIAVERPAAAAPAPEQNTRSLWSASYPQSAVDATQQAPQHGTASTSYRGPSGPSRGAGEDRSR